jgi:hypothetical protein
MTLCFTTAALQQQLYNSSFTTAALQQQLYNSSFTTAALQQQQPCQRTKAAFNPLNIIVYFNFFLKRCGGPRSSAHLN